MARRKHIKRIDPRHFLHETTDRVERRELDEVGDRRHGEGNQSTRKHHDTARGMGSGPGDRTWLGQRARTVKEGCPHEEHGEEIDISGPGTELHVDNIGDLPPDEAFAAGLAVARDTIDQLLGDSGEDLPEEEIIALAERVLQEEDEPLAAALDRMRADEPLPSEYDLEGSEFRPNWHPAHAHPDDADPWQRRQDSALSDLAIQAKYGAPDPRGLEDMPYYPEDPDERAEAEAALSARLGSLRDPPPKKKKDPWAARTEEALAQLRGEEDIEDRLANLREVYGAPSPTKDERYTDAGRIADIIGDKGLARAKFRLRNRGDVGWYDDPSPLTAPPRKSARGTAGGVGDEFLGARDIPGAHEDTAEEIAQLMMTSAPNYARDIDLDDPKYNQPQESIQHLKALVLQELEQMRLQEQGQLRELVSKVVERLQEKLSHG